MRERLYGPARVWVATSWSCSAAFFVLLAYDLISGSLTSPPRWLVLAMAFTLVTGAVTQYVALRREHLIRRRARR